MEIIIVISMLIGMVFNIIIEIFFKILLGIITVNDDNCAVITNRWNKKKPPIMLYKGTYIRPKLIYSVDIVPCIKIKSGQSNIIYQKIEV